MIDIHLMGEFFKEGMCCGETMFIILRIHVLVQYRAYHEYE